MICAQAIVHFRPKETYDRYLKLLVGVMILIQLFLPFGRFLLGVRGEDAARALEQFKQEMEQAIKQAEENAAEADALLEKMTLEEVQRRMEEQREEDQSEKSRGDGVQAGQGAVSGSEGADEDGASGLERNAGVDSGMGNDVIEIEVVEPVRVGAG